MASSTMREQAVPSPSPAITPSPGSGIDENQNRSHIKSAGDSPSLHKSGIFDEDSRIKPVLLQRKLNNAFEVCETLQHNNKDEQNKPKDGDCSNQLQDCSNSNNIECISPKSEDSKTSSPTSDDSAIKSLRAARKLSRREEGVLSTEDAEDIPRHKHRSVNNNESIEEEPQCPACGSDFTSWSALHSHLKNVHPDQDLACELCQVTFDSPHDLNTHQTRVHITDGKKPEIRKKLQFESSKCRIDRKHLKNIPKVIGFQDINFIDFSSEKFPLVAKDVCEKSLHLSKGQFCFECNMCGRGFPCSSALDIHSQTCEKKKEEKEIVKKNKRKSTPKFRPQAVPSESDESDDNIEINLNDKRRNDFFNSLDLRNNGHSSKSSSLKSSEDEADRKLEVSQERREGKLDLADIQSMISVTNIPGINVKNFHIPAGKAANDDKHPGLNIQVNNCQSSPSSLSNLSMTSPNFSVLNLISPNYASSDHNEEEAQDCFAAECRRMKLRGEFPCKLCPQIFPNLRALKGHNRVHLSVASGTPTSPYRCNICSYSSLDKATLVRHMRSHNGDRPYECAMCNYAFTTKANCERHLRNRHSKMTRDDVKSSIIYHPSEDPINDSEYIKTSEMNKKNIEKSKEVKHEFSLPVNLKINLAALKERQKSEDLFQAEHQELLKNISNGTIDERAKNETGTMTEDLDLRISSSVDDHWSGEEALDLRVNKPKYDTPSSECSDEPEDLTKKESFKEFNNNNEEKPKDFDPTSFPSPPFDQKPADINGLVKMYSAMYPTLSTTQVQQIILTQLNFPGLLQRLPFPSFLMPQSVFHNATFPKSFLTKDALGLQLSGGTLMDESKQSPTISEKLQYFQQEAYAKIMLKREKDRIANDFYKKPQEIIEKPRINNEYFTESDKKAFQEILVNREVQKKPPAFPTNKPEENVPESRNTSVKMVIKNGVLMPKQKQRRYRTERPFSCEHCSARFTLRSNMERHIKQQHPRFWTQKSRYNVGGRKSESGKTQGLGGDYYKHYDSSNQISINSRGDVSSSAGDLNWEASKSPTKSYHTGDKSDESEGEEEPKDLSDEEESKDDLIIDEGGNDHLRLLANVTEYLKAKSEMPREETQETLKDSQPQDLASVSKMLDNAVTQTQAFQKYFQEGVRKEEEDYRREEGDRSEEEEGLVAGSTSSDENRSESEATTKTKKKKSAYSMAPNRVSCPYCFRKFPWTSSLRRHVLTHTGQKPFKCTHCPLLFTTKSNCDRHLLRKHGREALIASTGQTENHEGVGNVNGVAATITGQSTAQNPNYSLRNVPERPYKCTHCPSSTFSSLSNLNKHMSSKHPNGQVTSPERSVSPDHARVKNLNPLAPPNVTISPNFPINIPKALSIIPQYPSESLKTKRFPITVPSIRVQEWPSTCNGEREEENRSFRKRSSSDETEATDRKRTSPDLLKISPVTDSHSDAELNRSDLPPIPASELPFKCHLCEGSFGERSDALDHIRIQHPVEFQLLMSKGALETTSEEDRVPHDDHDDVEHSRGRFPDYAHRKVMCAFCMRRFWSAEDLRRHMRTHTGERPFSCDVCHRKFTLKHSMLRHRKKHNPHDEVLVGSDEEHLQNHTGSVISSTRRSMDGEEGLQHKTILHQTLTRKEEDKRVEAMTT